MKKRICAILAGLSAIVSLAGCGSDPALTQFKQDIDDFCTAISELDTSINSVNAESENASAEVLGYLDQLDDEFQKFAELDFPEEFDYLEPLADEAGSYMSTAVASYHEAYRDNGYNEEAAAYARENSARAFKRVQIIITFLHGEEPSTEEPDSEESSSSAAG